MLTGLSLSGGVFESAHTVSVSLGAFIATFGILTSVGIGLPYSRFYTEIPSVKCFRNKNTFLT